MKKWFWLLVALIALGVVVAIVVGQRTRTGEHGDLERYKAELRAKGEKLSFAELGFPRSSEGNEAHETFLAAASRLGGGNPSVAAVSVRSFVAPGKASVAWATDEWVPADFGRRNPRKLSWAELETELAAAAAVLNTVRETVDGLPKVSISNPTNLAPGPVGNFVLRRNAVQWLAADCLAALRGREHQRARQDLHALVRFVVAYREDVLLVSQMIRIAIAGVGLGVTWEALQADGWTESELASLQRDWEAANLTECIALSLVGERAFFEHCLGRLRGGDASFLRGASGGARGTARFFEESFERLILVPWWRANSYADEKLYLQLTQQTLEGLRRLESGEAYTNVRAVFKEVANEVERQNQGLSRFRHTLTLIAMPHSSRAIETALRRETERRLTLVAIALKRHELRHGKPLGDITALVPEFLDTVPIDPMSGRPLVYRLNADKTFTLYSVGEDGRDDGGDPRPATSTRPDLWSGRDAVWPSAVLSNAAPVTSAADAAKTPQD